MDFFATSRGKSPCDGVGGTIKRAIAKVNLQKPLDKQILEPLKIYEFCVLHFKDTVTFYVTEERTIEVRSTLANRYMMGY